MGGRQRHAPDDTRDVVAPPALARREHPHPPPKHNGNLYKRRHALLNVSAAAERHKRAGGGSAHKHKSELWRTVSPRKCSLFFKEKAFDGYTVCRPTACEISLRSARPLRDFGLDQSFAVTDRLTYAAVSRGPTGSPVTFLLKILDAGSPDGCDLFPVTQAIIAVD